MLLLLLSFVRDSTLQGGGGGGGGIGGRIAIKIKILKGAAKGRSFKESKFLQYQQKRPIVSF